MKTKTKALWTTAVVGAFATSLIGGVTNLTPVGQANAESSAASIANPYIEYTFDNAQDFYGNTGASASDTTKDYTLKKASLDADIQSDSYVDIQRDGYVEFATNDMLYLPMGANNGKNPFANGELQNFTFAVDVNATWDKVDGSWFRTLFAMDSFTAYSNDATSTELEKYCRIESKAFYGTEWFRSGLKGLTPDKEQFKTYSQGEIVYGDVAGETTGWLTIVFSYEEGNTLKIKTYKDNQEVGSVSLELNGWTIYNAESAYKTFTIGGCYDTRFIKSIDDSNNVTPSEFAGEFAGAMDNIRIYDFAMTEAQIAEYVANKDASEPEEDVVPSDDPYIEYLFDTVDTIYQNTGTSASDTTKDYTLVRKGASQTPDSEIWSKKGELAFGDNFGVTLSGENDPWANGDLTDFTFAMRMQVDYSSWFSVPLSWDSFTGDPDSKDGTSEVNGHAYTRITVASNASDADWLHFSSNPMVNPRKDGSAHWNSYYKSIVNGVEATNTLYTGDRTASGTPYLTFVMSVDKDSQMLVRVYDEFEKVGELTYDLTGKNYDVYDVAAEFKQFTLGCAWDSRNGGKTEMRMWGKLDDVRVYNYAMTEEQIANYAAVEATKYMPDNVVVDTSIAGGTVTVDKSKAQEGETVTITVTPDVNAELVEVTVDGVAIEAVDGVYTATVDADGLIISATFIRSFSVTVDEGVTNGTVTADKTIAKEGETVTFTVTPANGYKVKSVTMNGATVEEKDGVYSCTMPSEEMVVSAEFAKWLTVSVKDGIVGGTVTVSKDACWENEKITINVKADEGYEIKKVTVNGEEVQKNGIIYQYTVTANAVVDVQFEKIGGKTSSGCGNSLAISGITASMTMLGAAAMVLSKKRRK